MTTYLNTSLFTDHVSSSRLGPRNTERGQRIHEKGLRTRYLRFSYCSLPQNAVIQTPPNDGSSSLTLLTDTIRSVRGKTLTFYLSTCAVFSKTNTLRRRGLFLLSIICVFIEVLVIHHTSFTLPPVVITTEFITKRLLM